MIQCPDCKKELDEIIDTTTSNHTNEKVNAGQHTGDIYKCDDCEKEYIDDHVNNIVREWRYW